MIWGIKAWFVRGVAFGVGFLCAGWVADALRRLWNTIAP